MKFVGGKHNNRKQLDCLWSSDKHKQSCIKARKKRKKKKRKR